MSKNTVKTLQISEEQLDAELAERLNRLSDTYTKRSERQAGEFTSREWAAIRGISCELAYDELLKLLRAKYVTRRSVSRAIVYWKDVEK